MATALPFHKWTCLNTWNLLCSPLCYAQKPMDIASNNLLVVACKTPLQTQTPQEIANIHDASRALTGLFSRWDSKEGL
jgi:hypothetical protein